MKAALLALCLLVVAAGNFFLPLRYAGEVALPAPTVRSRADVLLDILGESRTVLARFLWFKMDLLHEELDRQGVNYEKQADLMPLLRLVTLLDHHVDDAYDIIAIDLHHGQHRVSQAHEILDEGLAYNPKSVILLFRKAFILEQDKKYAEALPFVERGLGASPDSITARNLCRVGFHCALSLKDKPRAERYLRTMFALEPGDTTAIPLWWKLYGTEPPPSVLYPMR